MTMKYATVAIGILCLLQVAVPARAQETPPASEQDLLKPAGEKAFYESGGRRDPFRNLLAGKEVKEKPGTGGLTSLSVDDLTLIGIIKSKQKLTAIVSSPQGFPYFIKAGDKFADGFVLSINETQVVFRKTNERGVPLMRPKDILKEINPEER